MRATVTIDEEFLDEIKRETKAKSKAATVKIELLLGYFRLMK